MTSNRIAQILEIIYYSTPNVNAVYIEGTTAVEEIITIDQSTNIELELSEKIKPRTVKSHELARVVDFKSELLSEFWGKPMNVMASVLLPHNYDSTKAYPIRYSVAGYGGRYTRINYTLRDSAFMACWTSGEAPEIITVF